jgi:hypothetical protein
MRREKKPDASLEKLTLADARRRVKEFKYLKPVVSRKTLFDAVVQIVGPQQDLTGFPWWIIDSNGEVQPSPTRDSTWTNQSFQFTDFAFFVFWSSYFDAIAHVGNAKQGVFFVQGTINVQGSELFAASDRFWFKVRA